MLRWGVAADVEAIYAGAVARQLWRATLAQLSWVYDVPQGASGTARLSGTVALHNCRATAPA